MAVDTFQHCFLGLQSLCFGFSFRRGRGFLLRLQRHLHEKGSRTGFEMTPFRNCLVGKGQPTTVHPIVCVHVTLWVCDFEISNEPTCADGFVKI